MDNNKPITRAQAAQQLVRIKKAGGHFRDWIKMRHPDWDIPYFHEKMIEALDRLEKNILYSDFDSEWEAKTYGRKWSPHPERKLIRNIIFTMPPRHSKSTYATVEFPAYYMLKDPTRFAMTCSYNATLAKGFGREVMSILNDPLTKQVFPDFQLDRVARASEDWRSTEGGRYYSIGQDGTTSGRPATLLNIDDPLKSRHEAESATMRNRVWDIYTSALSARLEPDQKGIQPAQIVCITRWHPDDIIGKIQQLDEYKNGDWLQINFPAEVERKDGMGRPVYDKQGNQLLEPLWPARFGWEFLQKKRALNPRDYEALYMQNPYIKGGNIIKSTWWRFYDRRPEDIIAVVIAADTAFKKTETSDFSVLIVGGLSAHGDIYILDLIRGRWDFPELKQRTIALNQYWRGKGLRGLYIEDKASGQSLIQEMRRQSGVSVIPHPAANDKVVRINAVTPLIEGGRVFLPQSAEWLDEFYEECLAFPSSSHDDQIDALSICLDALSRMFVSPEEMDINAPINTSLQNQINQHTNYPGIDHSINKQFTPNMGQDVNWGGWGE